MKNTLYNLKELFTEDVIEFYKNNKQEITSELLEELRNSGNIGKQIALNILDLNKDDDGYYLDANGNQIAYKRIPTLKGINTKLNISNIHIEEIQKCKNDIFYFMNNYIKIVTSKGVDFPELRRYQIDFLETIIPDEHESIVGLLPRQCCSADTMINTININKKEIKTIKGLFEECRNEVVCKES